MSMEDYKKEVRKYGKISAVCMAVFWVPIILFWIMPLSFNAFLCFFYLSFFLVIDLMLVILFIIEYNKNLLGLSEIIRREKVVLDKPDRDVVFVVMSILSLLAGAGFLQWSIRFLYYCNMLDMKTLFINPLVGMNIFWLYKAWEFFYKSNNRKYQSKYERGLGKKERGSWEVKMAIIIIWATLQMFGYTFAYQMYHYIHG